MHEVLVNCLFKLAQEKVWLGAQTVPHDHSCSLGRKATKQTKNCKGASLAQTHIFQEIWYKQDIYVTSCDVGNGIKVIKPYQFCLVHSGDMSHPSHIQHSLGPEND